MEIARLHRIDRTRTRSSSKRYRKLAPILEDYGSPNEICNNSKTCRDSTLRESFW